MRDLTRQQAKLIRINRVIREEEIRDSNEMFRKSQQQSKGDFFKFTARSLCLNGNDRCVR